MANEGTGRGASDTGARVKIDGTIEHITFRNEENGYTVLKVIGSKTGATASLVGLLPECYIGQEFLATGVWKTSKYGRQFEADSFSLQFPASASGVERFLRSGAFPGIGPVTAQALALRFGDKVFQILDDVTALVQVQGITSARALGIKQRWQELKGKHEVLVFLYGHGVKPAAAEKIFDRYKLDTVNQVSADPYRLARDIDGIGFLTADELGKSLGFVGANPERIRAGLEYVLEQATKAGHCGLPEDRLLSAAIDLLDLGADEGISQLIDHMVTDGALIANQRSNGARELYLPALYRQEAEIAAILLARVNTRPFWAPALDAIAGLIARAEAKVGITLADEQKAAIRAALTQNVSVVTGGPGTGKTTFVKVLVSILAEIKAEGMLCAPTGKAAIRLSDAAGVSASTIHRLIGFGAGLKKSITGSLLILDEASMLDVPLFSAVAAALRAGERAQGGKQISVLLIGDVDQLPSVGPGKVLADMLNSDALPVTRLNRIFRQGQGSRITEVAFAVNQGSTLDLQAGLTDRDFLFLKAEDPESVRATLVDVVQNTLPGLGFTANETQVLVPMRKGSVGTHEINELLKSKLNPSPSISIKRFGREFAVGDKVMQIANDYGKNVYNGEVGQIKGIDELAELVTVSFFGRDVSYEFKDLHALILAYAATVHKFQGSEEKAVVLLLSTQHFPMLRRNLLYTGITRAKKQLVIIGSKKAMGIAASTLDGSTRCTRLEELLKEGAAAKSWLQTA